MTKLSQGNKALRDKDYQQAIAFYVEALMANPELSKAIVPNITMVKKKSNLLNEKNIEDQVCAEELFYNHDRVGKEGIQIEANNKYKKKQIKLLNLQVTKQELKLKEQQSVLIFFKNKRLHLSNRLKYFKKQVILFQIKEIGKYTFEEKVNILEKSKLFDFEYLNLQLNRTLSINEYLRDNAYDKCSPNPLFDIQYYLDNTPELVSHRIEPLLHYILYGEKDGKKPNPLFNPQFYLEQNKYLKIVDRNFNYTLLAHYIDIGDNENRQPTLLFSPKYYKQQINDKNYLKTSLQHYLDTCLVEQLNPNILFNTSFYLEQYLEKKEANFNPLIHFLQMDNSENYNPSPLFDTKFYKEKYLQVLEDDFNPLEHYLMCGAENGCCPNVLFDSSFYLNEHPFLKKEGKNPLIHYIEKGAFEGYNPHPLFDTNYYLHTYPSIKESGFNPLEHFLKYGLEHLLNPNYLFDTRFYVKKYSFKLLKNMNPLVHYINYGGSELLDPHLCFDSSYYQSINKDLNINLTTPLCHFFIIGEKNKCFPNAFFDYQYYITENTELKEKNQVYKHYVTTGVYEFKNPSLWFDFKYYIEKYDDIKKSGLNPFMHYVEFGISEGRLTCQYIEDNLFKKVVSNEFLYSDNSNGIKKKFIGINNLKDIFKLAIQLNRIHDQIDCFFLSTIIADKYRELYDRHHPIWVGNEYQSWMSVRNLTEQTKTKMLKHIESMEYLPLISIIMPTYNSPKRYLFKAIDSVINQIYSNWELCIVDDGSSDSSLKQILERYHLSDSRIKLLYSDKNEGISISSNKALGLAIGEFIGFLDHDDELELHALYAVINELNKQPNLDFIYSDEDKIDIDGNRSGAFFKPSWSPEYFLSCMYTCHFSVYRKSIIDEVGGFDPVFSNAQDYHLALRIVGKTNKIKHIDDILYHWRTLPSSTASNTGAKPEAYFRAKKALKSILPNFWSLGGNVEDDPLLPGMHRVRYNIKGSPKVSIVIPTASYVITSGKGKDSWYVLELVKSINKLTTWKNYEIIVVDNNDMPDELFVELSKHKVIIKHFLYEDFNLSKKINYCVECATLEYVVLLNDDMELLTSNWIQYLLEFCQLPDIGVVGAKLLFPNKTIQHNGVVILDQGPSHCYYNSNEQIGYGARNRVASNFLSVTGACMMTKKSLFEKVRGFNPMLATNYNDVDFCLKIIKEGKRIVCNPYAQLIHYESISKGGNPPKELDLFKKLWPEYLGNDPYMNSNFFPNNGEYRIDPKPKNIEEFYLLSGVKV